MKKLILFLISYGLVYLDASAQKPVIDTNAIKNWEEVVFANLTQNGRYGYFTFSSEKTSLLVVKSTRDSWQSRVRGAKNPYFTNNNKYLVFEIGTDSIGFLNLESRHLIYQQGSQLIGQQQSSSSYFLWKECSDRGECKFTLWNSETNKRSSYNGLEAKFDQSGNSLIFVSKTDSDNYELIKLYLNSGSRKAVWHGKMMPRNIIFNKDGSKLAFLVNEKFTDLQENAIVVCDNKGLLGKITGNNLTEKANFINGNTMAFGFNDSRLVFSIGKRNPDIQTSDQSISVDVWHYKDKLLQSQQLSELKSNNRVYLASFDLISKKTEVLSIEDDESIDVSGGYQNIGKYVLVVKNLQQPNELQLHPKGNEFKKNLYLQNNDTDSKTAIKLNSYIIDYNLSPNNKFVVFFDQIVKNYYCYNISTKKTINITENIGFPFIDEDKESEGPPLSQASGVAGWHANGRSIFLYDQFDIWQIDLLGTQKPVNITRGYGRKNNVELRFQLYPGSAVDLNSLNVQDITLLRGISRKNYFEGFCPFKINSNFDFKNLVLAPCKFWEIYKIGKLYLTKKSSNVEPPNWYTSEDLINYVSFSSIQPQRNWNWFIKELVYYNLPNGESSKGILYRPENFDPSKKYPVIFQFYETLSDKIYEFVKPELSEGAINPAWFTSRGYIVFQPDIHFKFGQPGESACNSVLAAAKFLIKQHWVDSTRMGLSGVSHGAFSVNYLVTKTNIFSAATSCAGIVDCISGYGATRESGFSRQYGYETSQGRMGKTLFEDPEMYINNSAIFKTDKVTTPILIMHNKEDAAVPWAQGLEWYLALRRLGKKAWMLQYDGEGHGVHKEKNKLDYTTRSVQFFDFYLRGKPAPKWMIDGIPGKMKMKDSGLELDTTGRQP